jgi:hypothetical protein
MEKMSWEKKEEEGCGMREGCDFMGWWDFVSSLTRRRKKLVEARQ